jgi:hypothetical protein
MWLWGVYPGPFGVSFRVLMPGLNTNGLGLKIFTTERTGEHRVNGGSSLFSLLTAMSEDFAEDYGRNLSFDGGNCLGLGRGLQ